jgi:hypothetical protein
MDAQMRRSLAKTAGEDGESERRERDRERGEVEERERERARTERQRQEEAERQRKEKKRQEANKIEQQPMDRTEALKLLGFAPTALPSRDEIKKAYRAGALKYHPDRQHNHEDPEKAAAMFRRVKAAFDILAA